MTAGLTLAPRRSAAASRPIVGGLRDVGVLAHG
jgi:hypothetical protein